MKIEKKVLELFDEQKDFMNDTVASNIEKYRKGNAKIVLEDENGSPVSNAKIDVVQKNHEFRFGANIFMLEQLETEEKNEAYKKHFADLFNMATLPFYWNTLEPEKGKPRYDKDSEPIYRRPATDICIDFCEKNNIEPREHALAYEQFFPQWLSNASVDEVKYALEKRFSEIAERYADKINTIEVTNEMCSWKNGATAFYSEPDYVEWCFKTAEKYFPNNQLGINDDTPHAWLDNCHPTDNYYAYTEANILKGARVDAIGMQYHLFYNAEDLYKSTRELLDPRCLYSHMDLYSNFGKPLQVTEVTIPSYSWDIEDEEIQAEIAEKLYTVWFSHPKNEQIVYWNLTDGYAHVASSDPEVIKNSQGDMTIGENYFHGGLLRYDMTPKAAYYRIKDLLQKKWHTELTVTSDENGNADFRGFYGDYDIEIIADGKNIKKTISLSSKADNTQKIVL